MTTTSYTDVDRLFFERWEDTMGLFEAYEELQGRMQDVISEVGERLERWGSERKFIIDVEPKRPAYYAWKDGWFNRRRDEAVVYFSLKAFAPLGYRRKVKDEHPSLWLYTENLHMLRMKEAEREEFARQLRSKLGDQAKAWDAEGASDADYPLGKVLTEIADKDRVQLIADPERLYAFATEKLEQVFVLADAVDQTLAEFRTRE